jgi:hypothetical protein
MFVLINMINIKIDNFVKARDSKMHIYKVKSRLKKSFFLLLFELHYFLTYLYFFLKKPTKKYFQLVLFVYYLTQWLQYFLMAL